ncbi:MAG: hypothetical protein SNF68_04620 [Rikenellaceae bacterium]
MKRFLLFLSVAISAIFSMSCEPLEYDGNDEAYPYVYSGMVLYSCAKSAHTYAMDGVTVATRFAILLAELENEGFELKEDYADTLVKIGDQSGETYTWDDLSQLNDYISKRVFLFGYSPYVTIERFSGSESGTYVLSYGLDEEGGLSGGYYEKQYRQGEYIIETNNLQLDETDEYTTWSITNYGEIGLGSSSDSEYSVICKQYLSYLWYSGDGCFSHTLYSKFNSGEEEAEDADWQVYNDPGTLTFTYYESDADYDGSYQRLLLEDVLENDIEYTTFSGGDSVAGETFSFETLEPIIYNYSDTVFGPIDGMVEAKVFETEDYENSEVQVSFEFTEGYVFNDTYYYNGYTYTNSYYYYY